MLRFLLIAFLIYLAYRFIFHFVIPVYRTSSRIKKGFREMSARMNHSDGHERMQQQSTTNSQTTQNPQAKPKAKPNRGDYIEFEEVK